MNKKIAIITYARFPSEMAYGNHLIQIANSFIDNGFNVSIYYPKTYNKKTIDVNYLNFQYVSLFVYIFLLLHFRQKITTKQIIQKANNQFTKLPK